MIHSPATSLQHKAGCRHPRRAPLPAQSPVQPRDPPCFTERGGHSPYPHGGTGWTTPSTARLAQHRLENESFRGFADYMQTPEFAENLKALVKLAQSAQTAAMCAGAVPRRRRRSLIADALPVRGVPLEHIMSESRRQPHTLTAWAVVEGPRITYPP